MKPAIILLIILCLVVPFASTLNMVSAVTPTIDVTVNASVSTGSNTYQTGFLLDQDWTYYRDTSVCKSLTQNAGFRLVRVINFKDTSPQPCIYWYESTRTGIWDWSAMDKLIAQVFSSGAQPLITLKSAPASGLTITVPPGMKLDPTTHLPNYESFAAYCAAWVRHYKNLGLPVRYWEVVNEAWYYFFKSWGYADSTRLANFVKLLDTAVKRMKEVDSTILVGNDAGTFKCFLDYYVGHGAGLGFLSFHKYDTGSLTSSESTILSLAETSSFVTDTFKYGPVDASNKYYTAKGVRIPLLLTETNLSYLWKDGSDPRIQRMVGAVWTALVIRTCILKGVQYSAYYCFSSSKNSQQQQPTHGFGMGLINRDTNLPWYPYYVNQMIGKNLARGDRLVQASSTSNDIRALAWIHNSKLNLFIICKVNSARNLSVHGVTGTISYQKIDNTVSYLTPKIQTGNSDASRLMYLPGYTVMLIQPHAPGDLNGDGQVSLLDLPLLANAYNSHPGDPNWNPLADIASPYGIIGLTDLVTMALYNGQQNP